MEPIKKLTKEQRHDIYVIALEIMKDLYTNWGLCGCIYAAAHKYFFNQILYGQGEMLQVFYDVQDIELLQISPYDEMKKYPEIIKHKPVEYDLYWFPKTEEGKQIRISILEQAIKETK
jgi:hypothetical protein